MLLGNPSTGKVSHVSLACPVIQFDWMLGKTVGLQWLSPLYPSVSSPEMLSVCQHLVFVRSSFFLEKIILILVSCFPSQKLCSDKISFDQSHSKTQLVNCYQIMYQCFKLQHFLRSYSVAETGLFGWLASKCYVCIRDIHTLVDLTVCLKWNGSVFSDSRLKTMWRVCHFPYHSVYV